MIATRLESPYKGLVPFEDTELDALLFFGRERESEIISANVLATRLTVLYGPSGVGKTSVLRAGVAHRLRRLARENIEERGHPEFAVVVFDAWSDDPVPGLRAAVRRELGDLFGSALLDEREGEYLADTLARWTDALACDILLVLDQAEEYFLYHAEETRFAEELPELVTRPGLRVRVLLSFRDDALAKLDRFKGRIPNLFANYLRLDHLDRSSARAAIVRPVERYNELVGDEEPIEVEPTLIEAVLDQTAAGKVDLGETGRGLAPAETGESRIEAPYLQLVLERVWEEERSAGAHRLRAATLDRLGGAESIVRTHLRRAVDALSASEKDVAADVFRYLVTPSGTKIAHGVGDLAEYASVDERRLMPVLAALRRERIVRPVDGVGPDGARYEIFHDVLAEAVLAWRRERELERERRAADRRHRRLALVAAGALIALAAMTAVALYALAQRSEARERRIEAHSRELLAQALNQFDVDPELSLLLSLQAARLEDTPQVENGLRRALIGSRVRAVFRAGAPVVAAAYSPDGRRVLLASQGTRVRIFDTRRTRPIVTFDAKAPIADASFSPDGRLVVTADRGGAARIWRAATGRELHVLRHRGPVAGASFSPDGRLVVTASADHTVGVWRVDSGARLARIHYQRPVRVSAFSPDGRFVVTVARDRVARVFHPNGQPLYTLDQGGRVTSAVFSPGGRLVTTGVNRKARIWTTTTGRLVADLGGHVGPVLTAAIDPRGKLLVTGSSDGTGRVWNLGQAEPLAVLTGHTNHVTDAAFDRGGFSVATASRDRTARTWKPSTGNPRAVLAGHTESVTMVSFRPDGKALLTASDDGTARVWDPETQPELSLLARSNGPVDSAVFSPDGRQIAIAGADGALIVRSRGGAVLRRLGRERVTDVAFSPDGSLVATAVARRATIWRTESGARVRVLGQPTEVTAVAFGPDGRQVATAGREGLARLWRLDGALVRAFGGHRAALTSVAFSPDGRRLITASEDKTARIWSRRTGALERVLRGHRAGVTCASFSPNGSSVVTSSRDRDARTWNVATGRLRRVFRGHFGPVSCASFSPGGRWIVTAGPGTAGLWDAASARRLFYLRGHSARLTSATFDRAGRRVVTSATDGDVRVYRCQVCGGLDDLVALAKARLARTGRTLTPAERRTYLRD